jgi:hypothetical protein
VILCAAMVGGLSALVVVLLRWPAAEWRQWLPDLLVGWAFLGSGAFIAGRPRGGREGAVVAAVGAAWFLGDIWPGLGLLHRGVLVHAAAGMPHGRLSTRLGRAVVALGYAGVALSWFDVVPLVPVGLAAALMAVSRSSPAPRRSACLLVGALLATVSLAQFAAGAEVEAAVLLLYETGLVVVAALLAVIFMRASSRSVVMDLVVEMGPRDALADLARRDPTVHEDPALRAAVAAADRLRSANERLTRQLEGQIAAVDASRRRLLATQDEERVALEERLRHGPSGRLDKVAAELAVLSSQDPEAAARLAAAGEHVSAARADLSRIARGLYPDAIADGSLESALHAIAASCPIPVALDLPVTQVGTRAAAVVYFVCSEATANAARHSRATRIGIRVQRGTVQGSDDQILVEVSDDGIGGAALDRGSGLQGLADRVGIAGGTLSVDSGPWGTRIAVRVPDDIGDAGEARGSSSSSGDHRPVIAAQ